ncbi:MAG: U32 family peptidase [Candidatus Sumerlaeia bacterium]|nr:U32 family peptidase [Candidatus Sumerlaeia bacterium]
MKLRVSTNWDTALLRPLAETGVVEELYGKLAFDAVGGPRPGFLLPQVTREQVADYVAACHAHGIKFNYLLNALSLGNLQYSREGFARIVELIEWVAGIGCDTATVGTPFMLRMVKTYAPNLKIKVSTVARVNNAQMARRYEDLGADEIIVDENLNRNFRMLRAIREAVACELELIVNPCCMWPCPAMTDHVISDGHASQEHFRRSHCYLQLPHFCCTRERFSNPVEIIKARWIRPEDLAEYEAIGYRRFKVVERFKNTRALLHHTRAYASRRYDGNLLDLLSLPNRDNYVAPCFEYFNQPEHINMEKVLRVGQMLEFSMSDLIQIDNRKLDGFLEFFKTCECEATTCERCGYCQNLADTVVVHRRDEALAHQREYDAFIESMFAGDVYR